MTSREAIDAWNRYRDDKRVTATKPDDMSVPMGKVDFLDLADPDYYGYMMVEAGMSDLCKLRSQRETLQSLLVHVYAKGLSVRSFNQSQFGWDHEAILSETLSTLHRAIMAQIAKTEKPAPIKAFEVA